MYTDPPTKTPFQLSDKLLIALESISEKEKIVIKHKLEGKTMKELEGSTGITAGYGNNLFQRAKRKTNLNSAKLLILAKVSGIIINKKK